MGTGALGRHHVRILSNLMQVQLVGVYDVRADVAREVAQAHSTVSYPSMAKLAGDVEAMVVAVPTADHAHVGCELLARGLHVLVEKPIAASLEEADRLIAAGRDRVLAVGHVEFYNPVVHALLALESVPRYVEVERLGAFTPRSLDIDVVLDLMIHDLQILHAMDTSEVREVRAVGINVLSPRIDIANVWLELESGCVANLTASRVSAEKVRHLRVFLPNGYYSADYQEQSIKSVRLAREESQGAKGEPACRRIVADSLTVDRCEPLRRELECFVDRCGGGAAPLVDGHEGRRALATALAVTDTIATKIAPRLEPTPPGP